MFTEGNTVQDFIRSLLAGAQHATGGLKIGEPRIPYGRDNFVVTSAVSGWKFIPGNPLPRAETDVLIETHLHDALIR